MKFDIYKIADNYKLSETERQVLQYILTNIDSVLTKGVRDVATINYTSAATIIKLSKKLGYTGYVDMIYRLNFIVKNHQNNQEHTSDITSFISEIENKKIEDFKPKNVEFIHEFLNLSNIICLSTLLSQ